MGEGKDLNFHFGNGNRKRLLGGAVLMLLFAAGRCPGADIVFVYSGKQAASSERQQTEAAARFYGVELEAIDLDRSGDPALKAAAGSRQTRGVVIAASALNENSERLWRMLEARGRSLPVLILGIRDGVAPSALRAWTNGAAAGCAPAAASGGLGYKFGQARGITEQLSGIEMPGAAAAAAYLQLEAADRAEAILNLEQGGGLLPVFAETKTKTGEVFFSCEIRYAGMERNDDRVIKAFLPLSPALLFIRHSAQQAAWRAPGHYANLTIDDPWLREPYGHISYGGLLQEMEKHNFHTTIAFIPWNYQRSQAAVSALFRQHPERFSVAVHGDNHDHKEFTDYRSKPLSEQLAAMRQAAARMEKFGELTGIGYDKVMVFPHSIAPLPTVAALRELDFLGTINATNVPQGEPVPAEAGFGLRPFTELFGGVPSISRQSMAEPVSAAFLAVNAYLENPMFFYGHSEDFATGIGAFDGIADQVNALQPDTQWKSLGEIIRHLYRVKRRGQNQYQVIAFSDEFVLENPGQRQAQFQVEKREEAPASASLLVDGKPAPFQFENGKLVFAVSVPGEGRRSVRIQHAEQAQIAAAPIGHDSAEVYLLRAASDFRDIYLSKSKAGLAFIRFYNRHELTPAELLPEGALLLLVLVFAGYRLQLRRAGNRAARMRGIPAKPAK